ncbi:MAG: hypothetical protein H6713_37140 [Myxococcales bacterium]|nr:hypothetical protein [Myxococcales bacterium]MCB9755590.1 hypothetical protein [Myxococcales bacterium]
MAKIPVDYRRFLITGRFGPLEVGDPWTKVVAALGECPDYGEDRWGTGYATYGCVDITTREGAVLTIKLTLRRPHLRDPAPAPPPEAVELLEFERPALTVAQVDRLLADAGVERRTLDALCDATTTYYQTAAGVHIQLERGRVLAVCAQGMFAGWVESA